MELYAVGLSWHRGVREIEEWLSRSSGVPIEELRPYLFLLRDRDATSHLLRVSGGLDSLVMGEGQILAQVRQVRSPAHWPPTLPAFCVPNTRSLTMPLLMVFPCACMHARTLFTAVTPSNQAR